jgi:hypothetical protein
MTLWRMTLELEYLCEIYTEVKNNLGDESEVHDVDQ